MKKFDAIKLAVLALALFAPAAGCGKVKAAKGKITGATDGSKDGAKDGTPDKLPPTDPIKINGNVEQWANGSLKALNLPAANGDAAKPQDSCTAYYDSMVNYAQAMQAIYVKRYLAWARYQLAIGGFKGIIMPPTPMPDYPYGGGGVDNASVGAPSGGTAGNAGSSAGKAADTAPSAASTASSAPSTASTQAQPSPTAPGAVASEYQTNNQVTGVDETDYVKSNGRYVFVASGNLLRGFDLNGAIVYTAQIAGENPRGLHLAGDKLVLITESTIANPYTALNVATPFGSPDYWWSYWGWWRQRLWWYQNVTNVHEFSIGDTGNLTSVKDRKYFGSFRDGREINGTVHLVMQKQLPWDILQTGLNLYLHPAYYGLADEAAVLAYAQRIAEENLNAWRTYMFEDSQLMADHRDSYKAGHCAAFSRLTSTTADKIVGEQLAQVYQSWDNYVVYAPGYVDSIYQSYPVFPTYDNVTTVASIDLTAAHPDVLGMTIAPVQADMVYASSDQLVVGNQRYEWRNYWRQLYVLPAVAAKPANCIGDAALCASFGTAAATGITPIAVVPAQSITQTTNFFDFLTFKLSADGAVPNGIGTLPGTPINSYAIDASSDAIRMVVNEQQNTQTVGGGVIQVIGNNGVVATPVVSNSSTNISVLRVLKPTGADWKVTAELPLDVGGYVSGVRFLGTSAFVSTSDTSKAIYAIDLTNEDAPKLAGAMPAELSSTYFHPMDDGKTLIALGRGNAGPAAAGIYTGTAVQLAMIDISNLSAPTVLAKATLDVGGSQAEYDFKSFRFIPRLGLLVLPMNWPFRLDIIAANRDKGFADFGTVTLQDKLTATYGIGGDPRTMLFDDLLVGVFGNQDVGAPLNSAARIPALTFDKSLELVYKTKVVTGFPYYWYLEGVNDITPKWRSATLLGLTDEY